ncbi:MAG: hypothetical protein O3A53_17585, partial [Acidobacteria bacterium]|nr:hypothetical protein [Acidobacteriota bacterium]
ILLAMIGPRFVIAMLALFSNYLQTAYTGLLIPLLGFLFMPFTTLAYAWSINTTNEVSGMQLVVVIIAVLIDLGVVGGGANRRRRQVRRQRGGMILDADGTVE